MQFTLTALLALAASVVAQTGDFDPIFTPTSGQEVQPGSEIEITWEAPAKYAADTIKISLIGGKTQNTQVEIQTIATGVANSAETFQWQVDSALGGENFYGLVFTLERDPSVTQFSQPFNIPLPTGEEPTKGDDETEGKGDDGKLTTTLTTSVGKVTVTLSSCSSTSTSTSTTTTSVWTTKTTSKPVTTSVVKNTTTVSSYTPPVITTTSVVEVPEVPEVTEAPTTVPENAGTAAGASSFALIGGLALAMLAL